MAYVGTPIDTRNQFQSLQGKRFSGDGSETDFTLDIAPGNVLDIEVFVGNVRQDPNSAYTLSGTTLTFTGAPPSGTNNIYVVHQAKSVGTIDPPANSVGVTELNLSDGSSGQFIKTDGSGTLSFASVSSALDDITTGDAASTLATSAGNITIDAQGGDTDIIFKGTDGSTDITALTIDMSDGGVLQTRAGVGFPATQVANSGANVLDDYEEGTADVNFRIEGRGDSSVAGTRSSSYTKIGNRVWVRAYMNMTSTTGTASNRQLQFFNLPFNSANLYATTGSASLGGLEANADKFFQVMVDNNSNTGQIQEWDGIQGDNFSDHFDTSTVYLELTYQTA